MNYASLSDSGEGGDLSLHVTGLSPGTPYHYRARALGAGTALGQDIVFNVPPTVLTGGTRAVSTNSATLVGTLLDKGSADTVSLSFEYGITGSYGQTMSGQTGTETGTFFATIRDLTPGQTYHYRMKAVGQGTSWGDDATFATMSGQAVPPTVATSAAIGLSATMAALTSSLNEVGTASSVSCSFVYWAASDTANVVETSIVTLSRHLLSSGTFGYFCRLSL
jgi:hypothetical protein